MVSGESCGWGHNLANAFTNSVKNSNYDTMTNVEVESSTNILVFGNCVKLRGNAYDSKKLTSIHDENRVDHE